MNLLPHQEYGVAQIKERKSLLLGDEPGVGKTCQMIHAVIGQRKILILTLASLKYQMREEILKWQPNALVEVIGGTPKKRAEQWAGGFQFYIANYELLLRDMPYMALIDWDYIVCDEATRLSNTKNKQYKRLRQLRTRFRLPMTGTPISNRPDDIYGLLDWAVPGCLGNWWSFMERYTVRQKLPSGGSFIVGYRNEDELALRIKPFMLRRTKEEVLDLPPKIVSTIPFPLGAKEQKLYNELRRGLLLFIEKEQINKVEHISSLDNAAVKFGKLQEICNSLELVGESTESSKLDVLKDLLTTLNGSKTILFTRFSRMADIIERELGCLKITGDVDLVDREKILNEFRGDKDIIVFTNAGEYGLNVQAAQNIIHFDQPLSLARKEQREGRAHRMGQDKKVLVYNLVAQNTVDEKILKMVEKKQDISRLLLSDIKELING